MQPTLTTCKNCGHSLTGKYCSNCGEKLYTHNDKSVAHLIEEGFHFITHFEGKFFTTIKAILTSPGKLSSDYCNGIRKKYFKPLSFFLLLVVLYLLFPFAKGLNMNISGHIQSRIYGKYAKEQVIHLMASRHFTESYVVEHFHSASEKVSKILLLFIIPVMASWSGVLTYKRKDKLFFDHFIFATEINSFLILGGFLLLPIIAKLGLSLVFAVSKKDFFNDSWVAVFLMSFISLYTFLAAKRFYQFTVQQTIIFVLLFVVLYAVVIQYLYKFLLFIISLKLIQ